MIVSVGIVIIVIGLLIAIFQVSSVRLEMGPILLRTNFGAILVEHLILALGWLALLLLYILATRMIGIPVDTRDSVEIGLVCAAIVIVWGFVIRAHLWYLEAK